MVTTPDWIRRFFSLMVYGSSTAIESRFSTAAKEKIEAAGGTVTVVVKAKWTRAAAGPGKKTRAKGARNVKDTPTQDTAPAATPKDDTTETAD